MPSRKYNYQFPWGQVTKNVKTETAKSPIIYYGGKARDWEWIADNLPTGFTTLVDLFGGGGSFTFGMAERLLKFQKVMDKYESIDTKMGGITQVYNDVGNVSNFMRMLRDYGDDTYKAILLTPYSRDEYLLCRDTWAESLHKAIESGDPKDYIEWARRWYINVQIGFSHEEEGTGFGVSKSISKSRGFKERVDDLPYFIDLIRYICIERADFLRILELYDAPGTLFYVDPPYDSQTRVRQNAYMNEMSQDRQIELLNALKGIQGQFVLSGYHGELYDDMLSGYRTVEKTTVSGIANTKQQLVRDNRTEVLWIGERNHGLWAEQADVAGI